MAVIDVVNAFRGIPPVTAAPAPAVQATGATGNPNPNPAATGTTATAPANPVAQFEKLWENPVVDPNAPKPQELFANATPEKLQEAAKQIDFVKQIPADVMTKIAAGGEEGRAALAQALNVAGQFGFMVNAASTKTMVELALARAKEEFQASIPKYLKEHGVANSLQQDNPALHNPAFAPVVKQVRDQFLLKNPGASEADIKAHTNTYFNLLADTVKGTTSSSNQGITEKANPSMDFEEYFLGKK